MTVIGTVCWIVKEAIMKKTLVQALAFGVLCVFCTPAGRRAHR